jgi:hypothetical protein
VKKTILTNPGRGHNGKVGHKFPWIKIYKKSKTEKEIYQILT